MPVVDLELTGFYMNKGRWLEQLAIVGERRAELANELQEMLGEGVAQASLFGPPRANINLDSQQQVTEAMNRLGIPLPDSTVPDDAESFDQLRPEHGRAYQSKDWPSARGLPSDRSTDGPLFLHESKHPTGAARRRVSPLLHGPSRQPAIGHR